MWTALAMTAALSYAPAQGELTLTNIRPTTRILGSARKDADNPKLIPGEEFVVSFDIDGLKTNEMGKAKYAVGMEVRNKDKVLYREEPRDLEAINTLGGAKVPAFVATQVGTDTPPGEYSLTAIVKDRESKVEKTFTRKFEVVAPTFGLVRILMSYDEGGGLPAPPLAVPGQRIWVNFFVTGFDRDGKKQPHVIVKMRVLEDGKAIGKDEVFTAKSAGENAKQMLLNFPMFLNRAGKFTVELEASDEIGKKTSKQSFDITVQDVK